jgi:hypothetical protein
MMKIMDQKSAKVHKGKTGRVVGIYVQDKKYDVRINRQYYAIPFKYIKTNA